MENPLDPIATQLVGISTALAGLILVFLGGIVASYNAIPSDSRRDKIKIKYRRRATLAFVGFSSALLSLCFSFSFFIFPCNLSVWISGIALVITVIATFWAALSEMKDIL